MHHFVRSIIHWWRLVSWESSSDSPDLYLFKRGDAMPACTAGSQYPTMCVACIRSRQWRTQAALFTPAAARVPRPANTRWMCAGRRGAFHPRVLNHQGGAVCQRHGSQIKAVHFHYGNSKSQLKSIFKDTFNIIRIRDTFNWIKYIFNQMIYLYIQSEEAKIKKYIKIVNGCQWH